MRHPRSALLLPMLLLWLASMDPAPVSADHCGASATVTPSSGPPGTTFVFRTNLGAPSTLYLYRDDTLVRSVRLRGDGPVRFAIATRAGDSGTWRARAEVRGSPSCAAEASFRVLGAPDTATIPVAWPGDVPWPVLAGAAWLGSVLGLRRSGTASGRCRPSGAPSRRSGSSSLRRPSGRPSAASPGDTALRDIARVRPSGPPGMSVSGPRRPPRVSWR